MTHNQVARTVQRAVDLFAQVALTGLVRAEQAGRVPVRFTGTGPAIWRTFHNELTDADLAAIAIQDAGMAMPVPFAPATWWPDWPDWAFQHLAPGQVEAWLAQALAHADESPESFLRRQAQLLHLDLPTPNQLTALPTPAAHERWLELPGTGGWVAFHLCTRDDATLYFWENFTVVCTTPEEMLFAGLIAWELDAPPNRALPIHLDGDDLRQTLKLGRSFDTVVGLRAAHGHRDLSLLHKETMQPRWL